MRVKIYIIVALLALFYVILDSRKLLLAPTKVTGTVVRVEFHREHILYVDIGEDLPVIVSGPPVKVGAEVELGCRSRSILRKQNCFYIFK